MYTEFHFNAALKEDTPKEVIEVLEYMVSDEPDKYDIRPVAPNHSFFSKSKSWNWMLLKDSHYFAADTTSTLRFNSVINTYYLCIRCNLKNYNNEIEDFVDWINPYIDAKTDDFLGFSRYEKSKEPTIIRKK